MEPNRIGRALGIGARMAGAKLREQADRLGEAPRAATPGTGSAGGPGLAQNAAARIAAGARQASANFRAAQADASGAPGSDTNAKAGTRRVVEGAGRFGAALFRPFAHATSLLWNQIAGIFFALFTLFFVEHAWMVYRGAHWRDRHVFLYVGLAVVFGWFAASTFWRVRRKQRRG